MSRKLPLLTAAAVLLLLAGCAAGPNPAAHTPADTGTIAGFWLGLWHGLIIPVTFVISLFNHNVSVYEVHNNGGWYNFGFLLGLGLFPLITGARGSASRAR